MLTNTLAIEFLIIFDILMERIRILNDIISKGGLMAACAKIYINDKEKAKEFIIECAEMCDSYVAKKHWGNQLIRDINQYKSKIVK